MKRLVIIAISSLGVVLGILLGVYAAAQALDDSDEISDDIIVCGMDGPSGEEIYLSREECEKLFPELTPEHSQ